MKSSGAQFHSIKQFYSSEEFRKRKNNLNIPIGVDKRGEVLGEDLSNTTGILLAGMTGSGKSTFLHALIASLVEQNYPEDLKFVLVDPKMVEFAVYEDSPYLWRPVITKIGDAQAAMKAFLGEMEYRYERLEEAGVLDIYAYNRKEKEKHLRIPQLVFIVDEVSDLMNAKKRYFSEGFKKILVLGRGVGMHLVISTSRPGYKTMPGSLDAHFINRIALKMASPEYYEHIMHAKGLEELRGSGDMYYSGPEVSNFRPIRLQGFYVK